MPTDLNIVNKRRGGVFFTPLPFAQKALNEIAGILGADWLRSGKYRLWDMAAGTGHLEKTLPKETHQYCFLSTLEPEDVKYLRKIFPQAHVFQYDYLRENHAALPQKLQNDLADPELHWVILVNPPYATAQEAGLRGTSKEGVADTEIRKKMHNEHLGEVSRELYIQFLYRIVHDFRGRNAILGLFAPMKYLVSTNYQKFRDLVLHIALQKISRSGFIFSSENFGGTSKSSHFPVSFILWRITPSWNKEDGAVHQEKRLIQLDILNSSAEKIGTKTVRQAHRNEFLSRWILRPRGTTVFPPFGSALSIKTANADVRNLIADGFLASLMCPGNELQNQQQTVFLSGPQVSAGALSVTPENFEQAVVVFAARRIPKDSWISHVDQLLRPDRKLEPQFVSDCAVWALFDAKNQTAALRNVQYQGICYQIRNHFFPFGIEEVKTWTIGESAIRKSLNSAADTYVADWFTRQTLSREAQNVWNSARKIYQYFFKHLHNLPAEKFGIKTYDAGWYQIRKTLDGIQLSDELHKRHKILRAKILPQLNGYGITADEQSL